MGGDGVYQRVWLKWSLVRSSAPVPPPPDATRHMPLGAEIAAAPARREPVELRYLVQRARVERRWSVGDLAEHVHCDVETIAAFERGDELLDRAQQQKLRAALEL